MYFLNSINKIFYKLGLFFRKKANNKFYDNIILEKYKLDIELINHSKRVSVYTELLADLMCISKDKIFFLKKGALLHDLGKKSIDKNILYKPSKLSQKEFNAIKKHPKLGLKLLNREDEEEIIENIILLHHEKWDGTGYPFGLKGKFIPIEAQIIAVADFYDALTSKRPYKDKISHKVALQLLKEQSGRSFNPDIVSIFELFEDKFNEILVSFYENKI